MKRGVSEKDVSSKNEIPEDGMVLRLPSIAIVGRPNVGKSSLFNAILRRRQAIVHFDSGVTRDRVSASGVNDGRRFMLIDTGGLGMYSGEKKGVDFWNNAIAEQVSAAIDSAKTIIFVVDVSGGPGPLDKAIADRLRASGKKILVAANKSDNSEAAAGADEFHELGFDKIFPVSCLHRLGIDSLMDEALRDVPKNTSSESGKDGPRPLKIAVLGRPNVGKSSLVNRILGEERVIVSEIAGTTRDAIDVNFTLKCGDEDVPAVLVDTAGLRKKSKISDAVERYSSMRAEEALKSADIAIFMIEATLGESTSQDKTISRMILESGKGCIIVANKIDACEGVKRDVLSNAIRASLPKMRYAPLLLASAKTGYNIEQLFEAIAELRAQMSVKISTSLLNKVLTDAQAKNLPPVVGARPFRIYYGAMLEACPPTFTLFVNSPKLCADNYHVYIENCIRNSFAFIGFPVRIIMKPRRRVELSELLAKKPGAKKKIVSRDKHSPLSGKGRAKAAGRKIIRKKRRS